MIRRMACLVALLLAVVWEYGRRKPRWRPQTIWSRTAYENSSGARGHRGTLRFLSCGVASRLEPPRDERC